jgi:hypothetical protein
MRTEHNECDKRVDTSRRNRVQSLQRTVIMGIATILCYQHNVRKFALNQDRGATVETYDIIIIIIIIISFLRWDETGPTQYVGHYLAYCTSPGRQMSVEQSVE